MKPSALQTASMSEYLARWLDHMRGRVRAKTWDGYEGSIRLYALPALGEVSLEDLTPLHLQDLYAELLGRGLSGGTVLNLHLVLTQALGQAMRWGIVDRNPASGAQPPRPRRAEPTTVDRALAERLLAETLGTRFELPVAIALATGMRRGEILALRWSDLDAARTTAHVSRTLQTAGGELHFERPKTARSRRTVQLPSMLGPYLDRRAASQAERRSYVGDPFETGLIVDDGAGGAVNPDTLSAAWSRFCRRRGLPRVRFHDLRHAHATLMLLQGVHPKIVSERLGHASVGITLDTYSHVLPSMQREAVAAFEELFPNTDSQQALKKTVNVDLEHARLEPNVPSW